MNEIAYLVGSIVGLYLILLFCAFFIDKFVFMGDGWRGVKFINKKTKKIFSWALGSLRNLIR